MNDISDSDEITIDIINDEPDTAAPLPAVFGGGELSRYMRDVYRHPLIARDETLRLAVAARAGDRRASDRLIASNLRLVVKIAHEYRNEIRNIMDLIQEGNLGMVYAVSHYDPAHIVKVANSDGTVTERAVKFSSYAAWWIRAYMLRFIVNNFRLVKVGTTTAQRKLFFNLNKHRSALSAMGVEPTNAVLALRLGVTEVEVAEMDLRINKKERSISVPVGGSEEGASATLGDVITDNRPDPEQMNMNEDERAVVRAAVQVYRNTLTNAKEIMILENRIMSEEPLTLQELGDKVGVSRERMRQLEARVMLGLRLVLEDTR